MNNIDYKKLMLKYHVNTGVKEWLIDSCDIIVTFLEEFIEGNGSNITDTTMGICGNIGLCARDMYPKSGPRGVHGLFLEMVELTYGSKAPIEGDTAAYRDNDKKYQGEYLTARKDFADVMLVKVKEFKGAIELAFPE